MSSWSTPDEGREAASDDDEAPSLATPKPMPPPPPLDDDERLPRLNGSLKLRKKPRLCLASSPSSCASLSPRSADLSKLIDLGMAPPDDDDAGVASSADGVGRSAGEPEL